MNVIVHFLILGLLANQISVKMVEPLPAQEHVRVHLPIPEPTVRLANATQQTTPNTPLLFMELLLQTAHLAFAIPFITVDRFAPR
jgi:hypothetical protein